LFTKNKIWGWTLLLFLQASGVLAANSSLDNRIAQENQWRTLGLYLQPHRPTYFLPIAYNTNPNNNIVEGANEVDLKKTEIKYQLSFKIPVLQAVIRGNGDLYFAYTQISFWQAYNRDISSPFRDTNYEPEAYLQFDTDKDIGPLRNRLLRVGFVHQSNGRSDPLSRSWNRIYGEFILDRKALMVSIKPWFRIPEPSETDNNPDIWEYLGYGELRLVKKCRNRQELALLFRNNLKLDGNKGAIELTWTFPIVKSTDGMIQYFNGYGESLLDYDHPVNRLSIGVAFSNWLG